MTLNPIILTLIALLLLPALIVWLAVLVVWDTIDQIRGI